MAPRGNPLLLTTVLGLAVIILQLTACAEREPARILVFTAAEDFRHGSTEAGVEALRAVANEIDVEVDVADSANVFSESNLQRYGAVVFLNTSGDVLDYSRQIHFERYIQAGGGFVGIHSAADTERNWPWYGGLVGAYFGSPVSEYPRMSPGVIAEVAEQSAGSIPASWNPTDEWYRMDVVNPDVEVLLERRTDSGGSDRVSWRHAYDGGRAFYTALGHNPDVFAKTDFREHLKAGLEYALGEGVRLDYSDAKTTPLPEENRFERIVLADSLDEPTELELLGEGKVIFLERKGAVKLYDPESDSVRTIARLDVHTVFEDGLMGIALDPNYEDNDWVYLFYSPAGGEPRQHLSRFELRNDSLLLDTEIVMLVVRTQRDECCHTGGSVEFGPDGNLYLSTGDDTNPFASNGFAPIDERSGREPFDAQGTSANTNDLRGKILRITPRADGSYSIPEGNLFPPGTENARPEIYVMGNRNPYRISIDQKTGFLYWGEVGPDAGEDDPSRGPRGHDEVNQAREAGFFGWPYFVGDNKAYRDYDFASERSGEAFDPEAPVNESPNNMGRRELPPAQPAFIWYPYAESPEFPLVGAGGRNAMAGPVFHADMFSPADGTFPDYYDGKLFIYDWMRGWMIAVTMDANHDIARLEPFMPSTRWNNAIDMAFDESGVLYVIEYGTGWFQRNADARLNRVLYNTGNRAPIAAIRADGIVGAVPLRVRFDAGESADVDGDDLTYRWKIDEGLWRAPDQRVFDHEFVEPGEYTVLLEVADEDGLTDRDEMVVVAGNAPPEIDFQITGNRSFYWDGRELEYDIMVSDPEEGTVDTAAAALVYVSFDYVKGTLDSNELAEGHQIGGRSFSEGRQLIEGSDCKACHSQTAQSIGPSYVDVAVRYHDQPDAVRMLSAKIIQGGGGAWGEQAMAAHPQLNEREASAMVEYILSLADEDAPGLGLPLSGSMATTQHLADTSRGTYVLQAAYTDAGAGGVGPATANEVLALRYPRLEAERADRFHRVDIRRGEDEEPALASNIYDGSYLVFEQLDLTDIEDLHFGVVTDPLHSLGGRIELRLDAPDGPVVATGVVEADSLFGTRELPAPLVATAGEHDLYFLFLNDRGVTPEALFLLDWITFEPRSQ